MPCHVVQRVVVGRDLKCVVCVLVLLYELFCADASLILRLRMISGRRARYTDPVTDRPVKKSLLLANGHVWLQTHVVVYVLMDFWN